MKSLLSKTIGKLFDRGNCWTILDEPDTDKTAPVKIIHGKYKDLVVRFGKVTPKPCSITGKLYVAFEFDVLENPRSYKAGKKLESFLGDILVQMMQSDQLSATNERQMDEANNKDSRESSVE